HWLEFGFSEPVLNELTNLALAVEGKWPWLAPPVGYGVTIHDLPVPATATDGRRWAEAVWLAWSDHHRVVWQWATDLTERRWHGAPYERHRAHGRASRRAVGGS